MKKILFFTVAAATVMVLTGCSQSSDLTEIDTTNNAPVGQKTISFDTYLATNTRAGASGGQTTETLKKNGFGVFGYYTTQDYKENVTSPNFMYNTQVTVKDGATTWAYSPLRYWPNNEGKISFFAYAPYIDVDKDGKPSETNSGIIGLTKNSDTSAPLISYNLGSDITNSVDLLIGVKKSNNAEMNVNLTRTSDIVRFTFKHALAKFNIKAKTISSIDAATKVTIESVKITDSNNLSQTGTLNLVDGSWSSPTGKALLTIDNTNINTKFAESLVREIKNPTDLATFKNIVGLTATAQSVMIGDKSCYLIPTKKPTMKIEVKYWVRTIDKQLQYGVTSEGSSCTITKDITFANDFEANKQYSLTLNIGLKAITFDAEVSNWDTEVTANPDTVDISVQ